MKNTILTHYYDIKRTITRDHKILFDRDLAFYQGALWALANLDKDLCFDYIITCETVDERLK